LAAAPAHAQATRTWVSGVGDDANPCSRTAPCKTFAGAISKTAAAGEINCLDPGGYGAVTITKSITLNCIGTLGSALASGTNAVIINAAATDKVVLRNIYLHGAANTGLNGVRILAGAAVTIENCVITQFAQQGISDVRTAGATKLYVRNTVIHNNTGVGIGLAAAGPHNVVLENVSSTNNLSGLTAAFGNNTVVQNSVFSTNSSFGVQADSGGTVNIDNSVISHNGTGVSATGTVRLSNSTITLNLAGGNFTSYGNNRTLGNGSDPIITNAGAASSDMGQK